jgi:SAM-dependent methyltransferase
MVWNESPGPSAHIQCTPQASGSGATWERPKNARRDSLGAPRGVKRDQIDVLTIAEGFFQSCVLFACLRLGIFDLIDRGQRTREAIAAELQAPAETVARLLNAAVALKFLKSVDGSAYELTDLAGSVLVSSAGENYLGDWIKNLGFFCSSLIKLDQAVLKSGPIIDPTSHLGADKELTRDVALAMHNYAALRGKELVRFLDTSGAKSLLDLGCGPGTYAFNLGLTNPALELYLLDMPEVLEVAKEVAARYPLQNRVHYLPCDAVSEEIPGSYDLILVSDMLHMLGEETSRQLIKRLYHSVNEGGSLVIQAQYLRGDRLGPRWPALLDLIQLCCTGHGRNHTVEETRRWMEEAGFSNIQYSRMSLLNTNSLLRGYKLQGVSPAA